MAYAMITWSGFTPRVDTLGELEVLQDNLYSIEFVSFPYISFNKSEELRKSPAYTGLYASVSEADQAVLGKLRHKLLEFSLVTDRLKSHLDFWEAKVSCALAKEL